MVEVCFRKKGILGIWYNHNSGTSAKLLTKYTIEPFEGTLWSSFGFSSHDYYYARKMAPNATGGTYFVPVDDYVEIIHNGTGKTLTLHLSYK
jgi:hypothetical protein